MPAEFQKSFQGETEAFDPMAPREPKVFDCTKRDLVVSGS